MFNILHIYLMTTFCYYLIITDKIIAFYTQFRSNQIVSGDLLYIIKGVIFYARFSLLLYFYLLRDVINLSYKASFIVCDGVA